VSYQLEATSYPFFALVTHVTNSNAMIGYLRSLNYNKRFAHSGQTLLYKRQGYISSALLMQELTDTLETHGPLLRAAKAEREERERERSLVEIQDREFQESLRRDQEREQRKNEEKIRQRMEEELKLKEEKEREKLKIKEEMENQLKRQREEIERIEREKKRAEKQKLIHQILPPEPEKSNTTTDLVIRLTDGSRIHRRFLISDALELVFAFVATKEDTENIVLVTHYPRKIYTDRTITLHDAGLYPQASLFVEDKPL